jgi:hypothetical protein
MKIITKAKREQLNGKIEPLRQRVETWRGTRASNEKMPEELWVEATELAREYGVSPVQGMLRIDYRGLERRVFGGRRGGEVKTKPVAVSKAAPAFVELPTGMMPSSRRVEHTVELEDATGRRMTMKVSGGAVAELLPLAQACWRPTV